MDTKVIEYIEDLPLKAVDKWYTLLVYSKLRTGAWLLLKSDIWRDGDTPKKVSEDSIDTIKKTLSRAGIPYSIEYRDFCFQQGARDRYQQLADIYIAIDKETLDRLVLARKSENHIELGTALGYPKTAVDSFMTKNKLIRKDLDPKTQFSEAAQLTYFALSKDNWQQELETVSEWIECAKQNSSEIYRELTRESVTEHRINKILEAFSGA